MQTIHRTSHLATRVGPTRSFADQLAVLIDGQARTEVAIMAGRRGRAEPPVTSALIWIECDQTLAEERRRGLFVVGHGACDAAKEWSCVISYPTGPTDRGQRLLDVSESLAGLGWLLVSCRHRVTMVGHASIAVLINRERPGRERTLWLAAQSAAQATGGPAIERTSPGNAGHCRLSRAGRLAPPDAIPGTAPKTHGQGETWVNEGSACDDFSV